MTLEQIEKKLPNGFHDAFLCAVSVDYLQRTAQIDLEVWVSELYVEDQTRRESVYRRGRLMLSGLLLLMLDAPDQEFLSEGRGYGVPVDLPYSNYLLPSAQDRLPKEPLPEAAFAGTFAFTEELNSFLHIAARAVNWEWLSEARTIY